MALLLDISPLLLIVALLAVFKQPGHIAAAASCILSVVLAITAKNMPVIDAGSALAEGLLSALWPICLVVASALFLYNLMEHTGAMKTIKIMLTKLSDDQRILVLIIGYGFGNFMEGIAGFGTAVAIPSSMLVGIGVNPISAIVGCLVINSAPTAFGSVGMASSTVSALCGMDPMVLSGNIAVIEALLTFISPFFLVAICCGGLKSLHGVKLVTACASLAYLVPWLLTAYTVGPELPDIVGSAIYLLVMTLYAIHHNQKHHLEPGGKYAHREVPLRKALCAWSPYIVATLVLLSTSRLCPFLHETLSGICSNVVIYTGANPRIVPFAWVNTPGMVILFSAVVGGLIQGARPADMAKLFAKTLQDYWKTMATICLVVALSRVMTYSGMITDISSALIYASGPLYPIVAPLIGVLGGFVTGSGTSTSVLFGQLQMETAMGLGVNEYWIVASNVMGAGIGKMICPQSIAIGLGATHIEGEEGTIMSHVLPSVLIYALLASLICIAGVIVMGS